MIRWKGMSTDKKTHYKASGETYEQLYRNIQDNYDYDTVIDTNAYECKMLEVNGYVVDEFISDGEFDFEAYENVKLPKELSEIDYYDIINDSIAQAYYHEFESN